MSMMTIYEYSNLIVGLLTLVVLSLTLVVLRGYARDTKTLAGVAVEQLPRPWRCPWNDQLTLQTRRFLMEQLFLSPINVA